MPGSVVPVNTSDEEIQRICDRLESSDPNFDDCTDAVALITALQFERVHKMNGVIYAVGTDNDWWSWSMAIGWVKVPFSVSPLVETK